MSAAPAERRRAVRRGRWAERICLWWLRIKGYRILAHNYRVAVGEVDILALKRGTVAAIEVKSRATTAAANESVSWHQRRRVARAAAHFLGRRPELQRLALRFDVMLVAPRRLPLHLRDAWRAENA